PGALQPAGDGVSPLPGSETAPPAEGLLLEGRTLGLGTDVLGRVAGAVGLAEGVATGDKRDGLLVVHRHASKGVPNVFRRGERIRVAVRPLRIHVDQAHLHIGERLGEVSVAAVALVAKPRVLGAPEDLVGLPDVRASEAK